MYIYIYIHIYIYVYIHIYSKKKRETKENIKRFKAETFKRLSPRSTCCCFSHSRTSIIQKFSLSANHGGQQYFSLFLGPSTFKSILPALCIYVICTYICIYYIYIYKFPYINKYICKHVNT